MVIQLHNLKSAGKRKRLRVGRGDSAGKGSTSGRGMKGQHARSGGSIKPGFEGGRTTLILQTPKARGKGFRSLRNKITAVNIGELNALKAGDVVTVKKLVVAGIVKSGPVKILSKGNLNKNLDVRLPVSKFAKEKIEKAGGKVIVTVKKEETKTN